MVAHQLDAEEKAVPAHVANQLVARFEFVQLLQHEPAHMQLWGIDQKKKKKKKEKGRTRKQARQKLINFNQKQ